MRGQVSIELFFVFLIFTIVLLWTTNFVGALKSNAAPSVAQAQAITTQVALLADSACALNESISVDLNCIVIQPPSNLPNPRPSPGASMLLGYRLRFDASKAILDSAFSINAPISKSTSLCDFTPSFVDVSCDSQKTICLKRVGNLIQSTDGGCTP